MLTGAVIVVICIMAFALFFVFFSLIVPVHIEEWDALEVLVPGFLTTIWGKLIYCGLGGLSKHWKTS